MAVLSIGDVRLVLRDMLGKRRAALSASATGRLYAPRLQRLLDEIEAMPAAVVIAGRPLAEQITAQDELHDAFGRAIYYLTEAYLQHPALPARAREAATRVRAAFIPELAELRRPYPVEAAAAIQREPDLARLAGDLKLIPVAGGTLYDWAHAFIDQGKALDQLISKRSDSAPAVRTMAGREVGALRARSVGMLTRFRASLGDEIEWSGGKLPASLDAQVFSYLDELSRVRDAHAAARTPPAAKPATTSAAPSAMGSAAPLPPPPPTTTSTTAAPLGAAPLAEPAPAARAERSPRQRSTTPRGAPRGAHRGARTARAATPAKPPQATTPPARKKAGSKAKPPRPRKR